MQDKVLVLAASAVVLAGNSRRPRSVEPRTLFHEAYVWQQQWNTATKQSVAAAPPELSGLRVLALEFSGHAGDSKWPEVDRDALVATRRPVTAVIRINGSRLHKTFAQRSRAGIERAARWRAEGVDVVGIEVDFDCATAALAEYAGWLRELRPAADLRWSITALPSWLESTGFEEVARAVDELVVQVHAIRAPQLFDATAARRWLQAVARRARGTSLRVALPTYRVSVAGRELHADPTAIERFLRSLERDPVAGLRGVVWFRLPVVGDRAAWSADTLRTVIAGGALEPAVSASLVRNGDAMDVVLRNRGTADGPWPDVVLEGDLFSELVLGYRKRGSTWIAPHQQLRPGERRVVGWAAGGEVAINAQ